MMAATDDSWRLMVVVVSCDGSSGRSAVSDDMMPWCGVGTASSAAMGGCKCRAAQSGASNRRNCYGCQELVHSTPSLSLFGFMQTFLAAYNITGVCIPVS